MALRTADTPGFHPGNNAVRYSVVEDLVLPDRIYAFPQYVFLDDLEPVANDIEEIPPEPEASFSTVEMEPADLADYLVREVQAYRPSYSRGDILSIAIDLVQNWLTVFSGEPGTGKTSICNIFAQVLGLRMPGRYIPVSVERGWTSKRDFIGYYNPLGDSIVEANTRLFRAIKEAGEWENAGREPAAPLLVLLDEANLSPMEYYWSDFISIAGGSEDEAERLISLGGGQAGDLTISKACRFAATINNDHTTEPLSPRIIDRAAVVVLPKAAEFVPGKKLSREETCDTIAWTSLQAAFDGSEDELTGRVQELYKELKKQLAAPPLNVAVRPRTELAIRRFWNAAQRVFEGENAEVSALDYAAAQRLLPKLAGGGIAYHEALEGLRHFCGESGLEKCAEILEDMLRRGGEADSALSYYSFFTDKPL